MATYEHILKNGNKVQVDSAIRDGDGVNISAKYAKKTELSSFITRAVNDLTNYYTKSNTYTKEEINNIVSMIPKFSIRVVTLLPTSNISSTTIYLLRNTSSDTTNMYDEYIYNNEAWEKLGTQDVDLSGYVKYDNTENISIQVYDDTNVSKIEMNTDQITISCGDDITFGAGFNSESKECGFGVGSQGLNIIESEDRSGVDIMADTFKFNDEDVAVKNDIPEIYQTTGANIDGAMSQKASTDNFAKKYDSAYFVNGVGISRGQSNLSTKWQGVVDGITEPYDGMKVFYRINTWGSASSAGAVLSLDGGTHYYPIVYNVNSAISSRYSAGSVIVICFNSTQTARAYLTAGVATTVTGCWQIMDYGNYSYMRMYNLATTDDDRDLVMRYDASSIASGANSDKFGAITSNVILKANPKTGQLKAVKFTENGVDLEAKYALISSIPDISGKANVGDSYTKTESDSRYLKSDGDVSVNGGLYVKTAIELGNEETPSHAYIDFHTDGSSTTDYNARLWVKTNENNMNFIGGNFYINGKQTATINDLDKYDDWCIGYDSSESSKGWYKFLTFNWAGNTYANRDLHIMVSSTYGENYSGSLHLNIRWDTSSLATGGTCTWDWISGDRQFRSDSVKLVRSDNKVDCYFYQPIDAGWHFTTFRVTSDNIRGAAGGVTWEKISGNAAPITSLDNVWITSNMGGAERYVLDEEIQTNSQWIDGKPIYRLTKYVNLPDNESWTDLFYLHSSSTIAQIIKIEGVVNSGQRLISLPVGEGSYYRNLRWDAFTGYIQTINNGFQGDAYITVYFTKN